MMRTKIIITILAIACLSGIGFSQEDTTAVKKDSVNIALLESYNKRLLEIEKQRIADSVQKVALEQQLNALKTTDNLKKEELQAQLIAINEKENSRISEKRARIDSLKKVTKGYPVTGFFGDTLFLLYSKSGSFSPKERAEAVNKRIEKLGSTIDFDVNSLKIENAETTFDILQGESIIMSINESDALWNNTTKEELAKEYVAIINAEVIEYKEETNYLNLAMKIGLAILVLLIIAALVKYISKLFAWTALKIQSQENKKIKGVQIKNYTLFDAKRQISVLLLLNNAVKWFTIVVAIYIALPILFGIFPWTQHFAATLFGYVLDPLKNILLSFWNYLPNLITIIVIIVVYRYVLRAIRFLKDEIAQGNLQLNGFYPDWAEPTYQIVRILLLAFMFVVLWPYLPGSDSPIFKGVSVFLGFLFTFGSAGSLSNVIAGLVLTYMRLFTIGDRVKIGDVTGDVIEKSALVTRVRTPFNEIISIPNSTVMNSHTINYSSDAPEKGLIVHTTVTIGYDVPWKDVHTALIDAALRTELILKEPNPFVFQTGLEDFYVAYEVHAYVREANKQGSIYSDLRQNIQDVFNERGIEILSPHYRAARDGNSTTIPANYLPKDYEAPSFNIRTQGKK
ncbi:MULTISPECIES: mechanosensitive ion channel family protein [Flavobacteriales]|uniref:Mechanosensitive ion channel n=1 Tax=Aequorivita viscosa TaxID=797419 RepID=A0A1M6J6Z8_9FLAO|nr:mechanosensitive ion channel family protein [Aequorivita viscosa]SDX06638.1 Mechanosensitive ion channel [Aequorivita viscosa]SHJ42494.1 Mechanosensitive ion channel [Aequorivita viscosa]